MRAFLAIKYYPNFQNKELIEDITNIFKQVDIDVFVFVRDVQAFGTYKFDSHELMEKAFAEIDKSDIFIIDASEPSIGIGIEAGYAYMKGIPIYLIANKNTKVSDTIKGIANDHVFYNELDDILKLKIN